MLNYPVIDPIAISIGPVNVHWYGLMYLVGFVVGVLLGRTRAQRPDCDWTLQQVWDLLFYVVIGAIAGGRLGYVLFYNLGYYLERPMESLFIWSGGMSFHGGLLGVLASLLLFASRTNRTFLQVGDFLAPLCPLGLGAGRIGNFINQELWGRTSDVYWAMVFPVAGPESRHPSQLYEAGLEGAVLFVIVWLYSASPRATGAVSGVFLLGYGALRFVAEFFRQPDIHLGTMLLGWMTMGQLLCIPMVLFGLWLWLRPTKDSF